MNATMGQLLGKGAQGRTMGFGGPLAGQGGVPNVGSAFPTPGPVAMGSRHAVPSVGSVSGLRQHAARWISQSTQFGPRLGKEWNPATGRMGTAQYDKDGNIDKFLTGQDETDAIKSARVGSAVQGALGRAVTGGGIGGLGDIAGALLPEAAAGPIGWGIAGVTAVGAVGLDTAHMIASQRAKNAQFQSVMGGSNLAGMGQRIQSAEFGLSHAFTLGSGQAQQAFMDATQMGMRGSERSNALNVAVSSFNSMGASVAQSLAAMNIQAQSGYENFTQLEQSLKAVTAAAKDTAQNANTVRDAFISTLGAVTQNVGGGAGSTAAATSIATMQAGLGRNLANLGTSGLTDQTRIYMMAAASGKPINQFLADATQTTSGPGSLTSGINSLQKQLFSGLGGQSTVTNLLKQGYKPGANGKLSPAQIADLTTQAQGSYAPEPEIAAVMQAAGYDTSGLSPEAVLQLYTQYLTGGTQLQGTPQAGNQAITGSNLAGLRQAASPQEAAKAMANATAQGGGAFQAGQQTTQALSDAAKKAGIKVGRLDAGGTIGGLRSSYLKQVAKTGSNSTIIDNMLQDKSNLGRLFTVRTANGNTTTVNFQDLMAHYSDQLATGGVSYAAGNNAQGESLVGTSVASQYGINETSAYTAAGKTTSAGQAAQGKNQDQAAKKWEAKQQGKSTKGSNNITISATPQLAQLLGFAVNGQSVTVQNATGLVPTTSAVQPQNLAGTQQTYSGP
jgi:hypothetical protein